MARERRPGMELPFDGPSSLAYQRIAWLPIFPFERRLIMRRLRKYSPQGTLLDIGCGPGYLAAEIARRYPALDVIGLDISPDMLKLAARNLPSGRVKLLLGDAAALPLENESVDSVVSSASLHHWEDVPAAFNEIYRVLRPGGRFLIMDLRRDTAGLSFFIARILNIFAPAELKRTQGALGSLYTAFTPAELAAFLAPLDFKETEVTGGLAWMLATGIK
jgi:ubiquinone/menaquinone biosynthesis C-methylase UbiE